MTQARPLVEKKNVSPQERVNAPTPDTPVDRRRHPRISEPFSATVHGVDVNGKSFMTETLLGNLSAGGLYLHLPQLVKAGTQMMIVSKLAKASGGHDSGPLIAIHGTVLRAEDAPGGSCGVAVEISQKRFL